MADLTPPLKWAGGKRWLVPHLRSYWQPHSKMRLVEPFCGGLAISLGLLPKQALLNDANVHLINFYKWLQQGLSLTFTSNLNNSDTFYNFRDRFNEFVDANNYNTEESAQIFYYLNRTCFNGLCRFNKRGKFNVPFGKYANIEYMDTHKAHKYKSLLANWTFTSGDFSKIKLTENDFVYADPPYDVQFTQYSQDGFDWDDQVRLVQWLSKHDGPVMISNQATDRIMTLYDNYGFELEELIAPRMINSTGDRTPAKEVLAFRNIKIVQSAVQEKTTQLSLF
jgi:DNA adenine methylase